VIIVVAIIPKLGINIYIPLAVITALNIAIGDGWRTIVYPDLASIIAKD
jgi:hypothetical protein